MIIERTSKIMLIFFLAMFFLGVAINNIIDYEINFQFVQHVVSMDAMQPWFDPAIVTKRSITDPAVQLFLYHCIIAAELLAGLLALFACYKMIINIKNDKNFANAKNIYVIAAMLMMSVWYFGFNVIASNWFYMWANQYDASNTAYNFIIFILLSLIYVMCTEKN